MSTTARTAPKSGSVHILPVIVYFDGDLACRERLRGTQRFRRMPWEKLDANVAEKVVLTSSERLVREHYDQLRDPSVRVIALCRDRFGDPRLDSVVYAYLPPETTNELLERMVDNALDHIHLHATRRQVGEQLAGATREISELNKIGAALSAEHNTERLLELILTKCREITQSDAGSLYLLELEEVKLPPGKLKDERKEPRKRMRFKLAQNDSKGFPFKETTMELSKKSIAGYVALTGQSLRLGDAYELPEGVPFSFSRRFDESTGYRTKSILAVPMRNQKDEIVGVVQLLNAKRHYEARLEDVAVVEREVVPYTQRQQELVESLASQAAVAYENSQLYEAIQRMLEGFVKASVIAIEARDPTTSGHSFRVANLTVALAEAVDRADSGPFADLKFERSEMKAIRYASLLHDFGKVGVREEVLVKAKKLYPAQMDLIKQRFEFVKRTREVETLKRKLQHLLQSGPEEFAKKSPEFEAELERELRLLDDHLGVVMKSDEPTVLPEGSFGMLQDIATQKFLGFGGDERQLLTPDEVRLLSIRKGSLDESERLQIESHVVHTFNFLQQIPWTREIRTIPEIARGHHEKLNGLGYPYKLAAPEIPVQTRMMTISDIFDALSASDRPYKRAVSQERAIEILGFAVKDGELDPELFKIFLEAKVFEKWKIEPFPY
ncbi:MAG TPA: HD domain-containing phosphohydrolase [Terriglobales bacterium]|nr:HD domain-containing phosphohydrolase [Terriglobales bacterium]